MSHHGNNNNFEWSENQLEAFKSNDAEKFAQQIREASRLKPGLGATNEYPNGKLNEDDMGGIKFGCTVHEGKVILNFGEKPVSWIGFTKEEANELGQYLIQKASEI